MIASNTHTQTHVQKKRDNGATKPLFFFAVFPMVCSSIHFTWTYMIMKKKKPLWVPIGIFFFLRLRNRFGMKYMWKESFDINGLYTFLCKHTHTHMVWLESSVLVISLVFFYLDYKCLSYHVAIGIKWYSVRLWYSMFDTYRGIM